MTTLSRPLRETRRRFLTRNELNHIPHPMRQQLYDLLKISSPAPAMEWLEKLNIFSGTRRPKFQKRPFYYSFSGVSRHFEKRGEITVSEEQARVLDSLVPGFTVSRWDQFRLARVLLLLVLGQQDRKTFLETISALLNTADLRETIRDFSAFALLPHQEDLVEAAVDGLRSNIVDLFDSIALENPFPAKHFSEAEWNQMALKVLFINRPVYRMTGLVERANRDLALAISSSPMNVGQRVGRSRRKRGSTAPSLSRIRSRKISSIWSKTAMRSTGRQSPW